MFNNRVARLNDTADSSTTIGGVFTDGILSCFTVFTGHIKMHLQKNRREICQYFGMELPFAKLIID